MLTSASDYILRDETMNEAENCVQDLTLIDIGGIPDNKNDLICKTATHAVLLLRRDTPPTTTKDWRDFCYRNDIDIAAEVTSDYHGDSDMIEDIGDKNILCGSVHYLERGELLTNRPMIQALAEHILTLES